MKIKKQKEINYPYSEESIKKKQKISFLLISLLKTATIYPILSLILSSNILEQFKITYIASNFTKTIILLAISICTSMILTKKKPIDNPLFIDDEIIVSNKKKSNGNYENIHTSKFNIILGSNIILIIPFIFIISLTFSTIISGILNLITPSIVYKKLANYLSLFIIFWILFKHSNSYLIRYLRNK